MSRSSSSSVSGRSRSRIATTTVAVLCATAALSACGNSDSVTIRGDVAGLDSLAFRGDSLVAEANRAPGFIDSLRLASQEVIKQQMADSLAVLDRARGVRDTGSGEGTLSTAAPDAKGAAPSAAAVAAAVVGAKASTVGSAMSRRAQARGDSMARAFAARLTGTGADRARGDSARGVLIWQGEEPTRTVVLRTTDGKLSLSGMATTGLAKLVGSEIVVRGVRVSPRDVVVADYYVRAADGVPAFDGVILEDGSLRMSDGSGIKRVPLPSSMQGLTGARVWVAPKDGKPLAYGLIQAR